MTLKKLSNVLPTAISLDTLKSESYVQIMDPYTLAHYRSAGSSILLGGDMTDLSISDLLNYKVVRIDFNERNSCFEIYAEAN